MSYSLFPEPFPLETKTETSELHHEKTCHFAYKEKKVQISFATAHAQGLLLCTA